jgi:hypothetical protein
MFEEISMPVSAVSAISNVMRVRKSVAPMPDHDGDDKTTVAAASAKSRDSDAPTAVAGGYRVASRVQAALTELSIGG